MSDQEQPAEGGIVHIAYEPTGCDVWIPGVPKTVRRALVVELIKALGIDPKQLYSLSLEPNAVYAEVYALKDGGRYWDGGPEQKAATHSIAIPIEDQAPASDRSETDATQVGCDDTPPEPQPA